MKKRILSSFIAVIMVVMLIIPLATIPASAASYPIVMHQSLGMTAYCGETVPLIFTYHPAYNHERITVNIYAPDGTLEGTSDFDINNKYTNYGSLTVTWDTTSCEPGRYSIEIIKEFYTYYSWHTAPTNGSSSVTLVEPSSTTSLNNAYTGNSTHFTSRNDTGVLTASATGITDAYNAWQKTKVTNASQPYEIQMTEMYIGDEAEKIAVDQNPYNSNGRSICQWVLMKFEVKNTGSSTLEAGDTIYWTAAYLPSGEAATVLDTCTFDDMPHYDTEIAPGETKEFWVGYYTLGSQGIPFLKLKNGSYISTHPSCAKGHTYSNGTDSTCNVCHGVRCAHTYTNNADTTCNSCGAFAYPGGTTLYKENGKHYYIVNRQKVNATLLVKYADGNWYYVNNGVVDFSKTGLVKFSNGKYFYVEGGKINFSKTGLVRHSDGTWYYIKNGTETNSTLFVKHADGNWYYVQNGKINFSKTGLAMFNNGKYFYVQNGKINFSKAGIVKHTDGKWYYIKGGTETDVTMLVKHTDGKWYYVQNGKVNFSKTGLVKFNDGNWYYVENGKINFAKTGFVKFNDGNWYYVENGKINFSKTGLAMFNNGKYFYAENGKINFSKTGLVRHTDGTWYYIKNGTETNATLFVKYADGNWYYVQNGKINFSKTGLALFNNGKYFYVQSGKINFSKTGLVEHTDSKWYYIKGGTETDVTMLVKHTDGKWYYVQNGKVNFSKTGLVKFNDGNWYYVENGKINFAKTGFVKFNDGNWYYVESGKINFAKNGKVYVSGKYYTVKNGVMV